eukprot:364109-Chlamydomonas_euryale.AAC.9
MGTSCAGVLPAGYGHAPEQRNAALASLAPSQASHTRSSTRRALGPALCARRANASGHANSA